MIKTYCTNKRFPRFVNHVRKINIPTRFDRRNAAIRLNYYLLNTIIVSIFIFIFQYTCNAKFKRIKQMFRQTIIKIKYKIILRISRIVTGSRFAQFSAHETQLARRSTFRTAGVGGWLQIALTYTGGSKIDTLPPTPPPSPSSASSSPQPYTRLLHQPLRKYATSGSAR